MVNAPLVIRCELDRSYRADLNTLVFDFGFARFEPLRRFERDSDLRPLAFNSGDHNADPDQSRDNRNDPDQRDTRSSPGQRSRLGH